MNSVEEKYGLATNNISAEISAMIGASKGANIHYRGAQDKGKTLLMVLTYEYLIDNFGYTPDEAVGNLHILNSKYNKGYKVLKGDSLRQYLWDMTHKPYRHKIVMIDEIDSEFPARFFQDREQTEIALRMWHNIKLKNYILFTSHLGNGSDLIFSLSANMMVMPYGINWQENSLDFTVIDGFNCEVFDMTANNVIRVMNDYDRWEVTENTDEDKQRERPVKKKLASQEVKRDGVKKLKLLTAP